MVHLLFPTGPDPGWNRLANLHPHRTHHSSSGSEQFRRLRQSCSSLRSFFIPRYYSYSNLSWAISRVGWNLNIEINDCRLSQEMRTNMLIIRALKHLVKKLKHNSNISSRNLSEIPGMTILISVTSKFQSFRVWWGLSNMAMNSITTILTVVIIYHLVRYRIRSGIQSWTDFVQEEEAEGCASGDWANESIEGRSECTFWFI